MSTFQEYVKVLTKLASLNENLLFLLYLGKTMTAYEVKVELSKIGQELETIQAKGSIDDLEQFLEEKKKV